MKSVSLSARETAHFLLLIRSLEVELREVRARLHLALSNLDDVVPLAHFLVNSVCIVELARLIEIGELHGVSDRERSTIPFLLSSNHSEQRCFARAVGPDDSDDSPTWQ